MFVYLQLNFPKMKPVWLQLPEQLSDSLYVFGDNQNSLSDIYLKEKQETDQNL